MLQCLQYKKGDRANICLPDPKGALSSSLSPTAIESANAEVRRCVTSSGQPVRCEPRRYNNYTPKQKATIGKFAAENGVMAAKRNFPTSYS